MHKIRSARGNGPPKRGAPISHGNSPYIARSAAEPTSGADRPERDRSSEASDLRHTEGVRSPACGAWHDGRGTHFGKMRLVFFVGRHAQPRATMRRTLLPAAMCTVWVDSSRPTRSHACCWAAATRPAEPAAAGRPGLCRALQPCYPHASREPGSNRRQNAPASLGRDTRQCRPTCCSSRSRSRRACCVVPTRRMA